jgi:hypothetical protein
MARPAARLALRRMPTFGPEGTPDPDGDRRFAERPFALLEPVAWHGERHRGGYGVGGPGGVTTVLGLIFGPRDAFVSEPRLDIAIGSRFPTAITDEHAPWLKLSSLVANRDELLHARSAGSVDVARETVHIDIEGEAIAFDALRRSERWIAQGRWREHVVEIHAICIEPSSIHLRIARDIPAA